MKRSLLSAGFVAFLFACAAPLVAAADPSTDIATHGAGMRNAANATRLAAVKYFQQYAGGIRPLVQALVGALNDKNADVRSTAARSLADIGPSARDAVPALIPLLNDKEENVRSSAAQALGEIGVASGEALCGLANLLHDASPNVRGNAAQTLGKFGPAAEIHRPALQELLSDKSVETATSAAIPFLKPRVFTLSL
jgi:HEAT repeat protein